MHNKPFLRSDLIKYVDKSSCSLELCIRHIIKKKIKKILKKPTKPVRLTGEEEDKGGAKQATLTCMH